MSKLKLAPGECQIIANCERPRLIYVNPAYPSEFEIYAFNSLGWPVSWRNERGLFRVSIDGSVKLCQRLGSGAFQIGRAVELSPGQIEEEFSRVRHLLDELSRRFPEQKELPGLLRTTPAQMRQRYRELWEPMGILPPDQYGALVINITRGCSYNRCRFCKFYKDESFRAFSGEEIAAQMRGIDAYL